ncbi:MAG TPA: DUF6064 family protein [Thermoanaerobaculia bacterium]|nr:DUF6064 family protein [Thermoanaerobaculia bacterium]
MNPPATMDRLLATFERLNTELWPAHAVGITLALAVLALVVAKHRRASSFTLAALGFLWIATGTIFHWLYFRPIGGAGGWLAGVFVVQGVSFLIAARRPRTSFRFDGSGFSWLGLGLAAFAVIGYPVSGYLLRGTFLHAAWIGIFPCPVGVFTMGMFLMSERVAPKALLVIPTLWALAGLRPVLWGVTEDIVLLAGGLLAAVLVMIRDGRAPAAPRSAH